MLEKIKSILKNNNYQVFLILLIFIIRQWIYIAVVPPWMGPDETRHVAYIESLERRWERLYRHTAFSNPTLSKKGSSNLSQQNANYARLEIKNVGNWYVADNVEETGSSNWIVQHPPLYYFLMTPAYSLFRNILPSLKIVLLLRLINSLLALLVLISIYKFAKLLSKNHLTALVTIILFSNWPTFTHNAIYVNNDILLTLFSSLVLYFVAKEKEYSLNNAFKIGLLVVLALNTKLFAIFLLPLIFLKTLFDFFKNQVDFKKAFKYLLLIFTLSFTFGMWYYFQNYFVTGDFVSGVIQSANTQENASSNFPYQPFTFTGFKYVFSPRGLNLIYQWSRNYIGIFGWGVKAIHRDLLTLYFVSYACLLVYGLNILLKKKKYQFIYYLSPFLFLFIVLFYKNYMSIFKNNGWIRALQGRYYLFASIPLFFLMATGFEDIYKKINYKKLFWVLFTIIIFIVEARLLLRELLVWIYF